MIELLRVRRGLWAGCGVWGFWRALAFHLVSPFEAGTDFVVRNLEAISKAWVQGRSVSLSLSLSLSLTHTHTPTQPYKY